MITLYDLSDNELLDLLRSGDKSAFIEIYNRYWERLLAIAYNHTKDKSMAEEIVQQVFISLWDRRQMVAIESIGGYLATAVKSVTLQEKERSTISTCVTFEVD